ncbi:MAG: cobalamin biosynthesis bifunctional protein CbiET, partial [Rikenellaceae bacterium]|nr:cobalamin biosynthesis bifunctional protein CbiET [Rikenellaceae bacterium]
MKFYVIGINDSARPEFSGAVREVIASHRVFSGGSRHRGIVSSFLPDGYAWIDITVPLQPVFGEYARYDEIVAFASCDPLFFGFAATVQRFMPDAEIEVFPVFHSLQMLAHRILLPYQDMHM